jgi:uncharacterized protein (DUF433 family)
MEQSGDQQDQPRQLYPRIESDPGILRGKPIIQGSRLTVETILENFASGYSFEDLLDAYPFLAPEDITAALEYAAQLAAQPPDAGDTKERTAS